MKKLKVVASVCIILVAFIFFAAWYNRFTEDVVPVSSGIQENYKVYLITVDRIEKFDFDVNEGAKDMASLLNITYVWDGPDKKEADYQVDYQIAAINKAVENGANLIMLSASDPDKLTDAIKNAKEKNVKIIYVDSPAKEEAIVTLATDNYSAGITAAEAMLEELNALGTTSGSIGIMGVNTTLKSTVDREQGFRDRMSKDGRFKVLDTLYENGDAKASEEAADSLIKANPDMVGFFATNEGASVGVGSAIQKNNNNIIGIGFDMTEEIKTLLRDGSLETVLVQNPYTMGYLGMAEAYAALKGYETGTSHINTGVSLVMHK